MEKRLIIAISLSLLVVWIWSFTNPHPSALKAPPAQQLTKEEAGVAPVQPQESAISLQKVKEEKQFWANLDIFNILFNEESASINETVFHRYPLDKFTLFNGLSLSLKNASFKLEKQDNRQIIFVQNDAEKRISKEFSFSNSSNNMELRLNITNQSNHPISLDLPVVVGSLNFKGNPYDVMYQDLAVGLEDQVKHLNGKKSMEFKGANFMALRSRYFCVIVGFPDKYNVFVNRSNPDTSEIGFVINNLTLAPNQNVSLNFPIYMGQQDLKLINSINPKWNNVIQFGTFDVISQILLQVLEFFHRILRNWGLAIVLLSLLIYLVLFPLTMKQMRSMREMQILQPKVESLRKQYKDNPQKLNQAIMQLYRENKVNPLGGCLPMILQIPIFFALYQALARTIAIKGESFLWIKDLSMPDRLFLLPVTLPVIKNEVNLLPILMAIGMFIQQKISSAQSAGVSAEQQKLMLVLMPVMFCFIFYSMPAGLVIYWFINSMLMLLFQLRVNRSMKSSE